MKTPTVGSKQCEAYRTILFGNEKKVDANQNRVEEIFVQTSCSTVKLKKKKKLSLIEENEALRTVES